MPSCVRACAACSTNTNSSVCYTATIHARNVDFMHFLRQRRWQVELYGQLSVRCNGWAVILVITGSYIELTSNVHRTHATATTEVTWVDQNAESKQDHRVNQKFCPLAMLARTVILTLSLTPAPSSNTHPPPEDCPSVDGMSQPFGHSFAFLVR